MDDALHPEAQALLRTTEAAPFPPFQGLSVSAAREQLRTQTASEEPEPVGASEEFVIDGPDGNELAMRSYVPDADGPHPLLVYFHGGGFVLGDLDTSDVICAALCNRAEWAVLSVDYRLAPEHPFPAGVEDAYAAVEWAATYGDRIGADTDRLAVGGDSAGGNLAAATALLSRNLDGPDIAHQLLIYPVMSAPGIHDFDSYRENAEGYLLEAAEMVWYFEKYFESPIDRRNEYFSPLLADDLSGLPSASVLTAEFDPLRDEGQAYADRLDAVGIDVTRHHFEDMLHGFLTYPSILSRADDAYDALADDLASVA
ncbi:MAG: alpha/beta hydrolase [Haloarculaceae archaeon]